MLAYVFWHWRRADVAPVAYEVLQRRFHAALEAAPPPGFLRSRSAAIAGAPWAAAGGDAYEDWYLVEGSAALDPLNAAAVSASRQAPHDAAAAAARGGTAGLYLLRSGAADVAPLAAAWFDKPSGMSYGELVATLAPVIETERVALWGRQMTLGPAPEFCLQAARRLALPAPFVPLVVPCRPVWPEPSPASSLRPG
jgi:hypothetical protein